MQTISEPALVSPSVKLPHSSRETLQLAFKRCSFDVEAEYSGLETRPSFCGRDDSLDSVQEHRIRQYVSKDETSQSQEGIRNHHYHPQQ